MKRKSRGINYNNEVAFEKRPAQGFYDVGEEQQMTKQMGQEFRPVTLEEMEGKRRKVRAQLCSISPALTVSVCLLQAVSAMRKHNESERNLNALPSVKVMLVKIMLDGIKHRCRLLAIQRRRVQGIAQNT